MIQVFSFSVGWDKNSHKNAIQKHCLIGGIGSDRKEGNYLVYSRSDL